MKVLFWPVDNDDDGYGIINNDNLNARLLLKCEDLNGYLNGIQREDFHDYGNNYDGTYGATLKWILKKYRVNNDNNNSNPRILFRLVVHHDEKSDNNTNKKDNSVEQNKVMS